MSVTPSIACIGIIGKHDNPLHISIFPPHQNTSAPSDAAHLEFSLLLNASLDIFEQRTTTTTTTTRVDQDLGMLQIVDERLSVWGWQTGTGVKFAIVVDMWGREGRRPSSSSTSGGMGLGGGGGGLRPAFKALQTAYIRLLQNPFHTPSAGPDGQHAAGGNQGGGRKSGEITSPKFVAEVRRIGEGWRPGMERV
ncbi:MAG: hypothetical protein LQ350_003015 [Teloschistes chrysophthalmus]|nr:MAG: hypothetical protein LQ350_003015 [Niorma chrysophthalma]